MKNNTILLICISILLLLCSIITYKAVNEHYVGIDDDEIDFSNASNFVETVTPKKQYVLTPAEKAAAKALSKSQELEAASSKDAMIKKFITKIKSGYVDNKRASLNNPLPFSSFLYSLRNTVIDLMKSTKSNMLLTELKAIVEDIAREQVRVSMAITKECGNKRCACCTNDIFSSDHKTACMKKYGSDVTSNDYKMCISDPLSKQSKSACTSSFGSGFIFKSC